MGGMLATNYSGLYIIWAVGYNGSAPKVQGIGLIRFEGSGVGLRGNPSMSPCKPCAFDPAAPLTLVAKPLVSCSNCLNGHCFKALTPCATLIYLLLTLGQRLLNGSESHNTVIFLKESEGLKLTVDRQASLNASA